MPTDHRSRLARAAETAGSTGLDAVIVTPSADLIYLAGYDPPLLPRLTCLIVRPGRDPVLVVPRLEARLATDAGIDELAEVRAWQETEDPYALVRAVVGEGAGRVACSHRMWAVHLLRLQALLPETGNDEVTFTIVGSGPNGASPHHEPTSREILFGEGVVMDFGGRTDGYCSDVTRTVAVGQPPSELPRVHEVVLEAQEEALRTIAPDVPAQEVDRAARRVIERAGYGDLFVHRTGHGIGLEEHEWPYIVEGNDEPLRPGMCFSIEPGIYLPGEFGVRIEDIVTVTGTGAQRLNHATRELQVVR